MPALQWLGTIPEETDAGFLAKAIGRGMGGLSEGYVKGKEQERELGAKYELLDHSKKVDAAKLVSSVLGHVSEEKRAEMIADPEIIAVFDAAGVPIPTTPVPEKGANWMEQWMEAERGEQTEVGKFNPARALPGYSYSGGAEGGQKRFPEGVSEEEITHTMQKHNISRRELLERIGL